MSQELINKQIIDSFGSATWEVPSKIKRTHGDPLDITTVFYSLSAAQQYAAGGDEFEVTAPDGKTKYKYTPKTRYFGQVLAVIENGKTTVYVIDPSVAGNLKAVGSSTWQIFDSEVDAVAYLSSDDAKNGEVVSLSTETGYDIYKLNDLSGETFAEAYEKIIAHTDLTAALASYVQRTEISALSSLDKDTVDRLVEIATDLDSVLSTKVEESVFNAAIESLQDAIELSAEETLKSAKDYTNEVSVAVTTAYGQADITLSNDLMKEISDAESRVTDYVEEISSDLNGQIASTATDTLETAKTYTNEVSAAVTTAYGQADEALHNTITGEIAAAKNEAISVANKYTDDEIGALDYNPVISSDDTNTIYVVHNVTQEDGLINVNRKALAVSPTYESHKGTEYGALATRADISAQIASLGHVLEFKGVVNVLPDAADYSSGNVLIVQSDVLSNSFEYVLVEKDGVKTWVKLGDESSYILKGTSLSDDVNGLVGNLPQSRVEGLPTALTAITSDITQLQLSATGLIAISADHETRIGALETTVDELTVISGDLDQKIENVITAYQDADVKLSTAIMADVNEANKALDDKISGVTDDLVELTTTVTNISSEYGARIGVVEERTIEHDGALAGLNNFVTDIQAVSADHETRIGTLEDTSAEISSKVDEKIFVDDQLDGESGYVQTLNIHKVNNEQYAEALKAGVTSADLYIVNDDHLNAYGQKIVNVAEPINNTDAANKQYVDEAIANATPATATNSTKGIVQGTTSVNGVSVNAAGEMSVNEITVNKIVDSNEYILVLDGGSADGQNS